MPELPNQRTYFVVQCFLKYPSFAEARAKAPDEIAAHIQRSKELHAQGVILMAGAFLDKNDEPLSTMAIATSREVAENYVHGDPFYLNGMMESWTIREWANMFA
jgi:uncharacterized protein YciI